MNGRSDPSAVIAVTARGRGSGSTRSARIQGELLDDRVGQQIPGQLGDRGHRVLVRRPVELHLEPLSQPDPEHLPEPQAAARARDGLPLRIMNLRLEHYFHDHPGHVSSWAIRAYIVW